MQPKIDIGIACSSHQAPSWWSALFALIFREQERGIIEMGQMLAVQSALPDFNKNLSIGMRFAPDTEKKRNEKTDANRNAAVNGFVEGNPDSGWRAEYIFWVDDDTVPPDGTIGKLLRMEREIASGLYFNGNPPYNPIAYMRKKGGFYEALWDYPENGIIPVDSVGMGCTLIHRSVYEKIRADNEVFQRPTGSLLPIHKNLIYNFNEPTLNSRPDVFYNHGYLHMKVLKPALDNEEDKRLFPFYCMEYGRTEDHHFCELAAASGIRPWVDTSIKCEHHKGKAYTHADYLVARNKKELGEE